MIIDPKIAQRLRTESNIWLATVRSNHTPHLVPIWFVWVADKIFICTSADSVKVRNLLSKPNVSAGLEDGSNPVVIEGRARPIGVVPKPVIEAFKKKYDWNITTDSEYNQLIEIEPKRIRS